MWIINWYLVHQLHVSGYTQIDENVHDEMPKYVFNEMDEYKFSISDKAILLIKNKKIAGWYDRVYGDKNNTDKHTIHNLEVIYTIASDEVDVKNVIQHITKEYDCHSKLRQSPHKVLWHFTYTGLEDGKLCFTKRALSIIGDSSQECFETFDKMHHEHVERIKQDIDKLANIDHYNKFGLKRKLGYMFYGEPGCGKTATVVAMALHGKRHIIELPFNILTKNIEFDKIMDIVEIDNVTFTKNDIIMFFDEIDVGMEIMTRTAEQTTEMTQVIKAMTTFDLKNDDTVQSKLSLNKLLTKLDGIGNYNGLIIVGATNCFEKLDKALTRDLRLSPVCFQKLRTIDCKHIIQNYFGENCLSNEQYDSLPDRAISGATFISRCNTLLNAMADKPIDIEQILGLFDN